MKAPIHRGGAVAPIPSTKVWFLLIFLVLAPGTINANPVILNPTSLVAFCVVAFWAFIVETGIVTLATAFRGVVVWRMFVCYYIVNALVFFFLFEPLLERGSTPVLPLELLVVVIDASVIKFLTSMDFLQGESYQGLTWRSAFITSAVANSFSFLVGYIASHKPWEK
jgi:hypothetical protein